MSITKERFEHYFDVLTYEKLLAEKKLDFFLKYPEEFIEYLELEEELKNSEKELLSMLADKFKSIEERDMDALEQMVLDDDSE